MSLKKILRGTGIAIITPFTEDNQIDYTALGAVIDMQIAAGTDYLVTLGTTGETPTLSKLEKIDIIQFTYEKVAARVPVVVGVGGNDTASVVQDLLSFPLEKAAAVLSASPYYNKPSQEGIIQHYRLLAEASPKPIILYNVPGRTGRNMTAATTLQLAQLPNIEGMKEASGDMAQCMQLLRDLPKDFLLVSGDDALAVPQLACGMDGVISVAANAFPAEFSKMVKACLHNDLATAIQINNQLMDAYDLMFCENNPAGVKAFLYEKGFIQNEVRLPVVPLSNAVHEKVKAFLKK